MTRDSFRLFPHHRVPAGGAGLATEDWRLKAWAPACDIFETDAALVMKFELPEVKKEDVDIKLDDHVLTLHGERKLEESTDRENYHRVERHYGEFVGDAEHTACMLPDRCAGGIDC